MTLKAFHSCWVPEHEDSIPSGDQLITKHTEISSSKAAL